MLTDLLLLRGIKHDQEQRHTAAVLLFTLLFAAPRPSRSPRRPKVTPG